MISTDQKINVLFLLVFVLFVLYFWYFYGSGSKTNTNLEHLDGSLPIVVGESVSGEDESSQMLSLYTSGSYVYNGSDAALDRVHIKKKLRVGNIILDGDTGKIYTPGDVVSVGGVKSGGNCNIDGNLKVAGNSVFNGNLSVSEGISTLGKYNIRGDRIGIPERGDIQISADKWVRNYDYDATTYSGSTGVGGFAAKNLWCSDGGALYTNSATVSGNATIGGILGVTGNTTMSNATVGGTLGVTGVSTLGQYKIRNDRIGIPGRGDIQIGTDKWVRNYDYDASTYAGTTGLGGFAGKNLWCSDVGGALYTNSLTTTGNATIGGTLGVTGVTTTKALNSSSLTTTGNGIIGGTFGVTGSTTLAGTTTGALNSSSLTTTGNGTIGGTFGVTGITTLGGTITGALNSSSLTTTGNSTIGGTLGVTGFTTLAETTTGALNSSSLTTTGNGIFGGKLAVTGSTILTGTSTFGSVSANTITTTGDVTYGGLLVGTVKYPYTNSNISGNDVTGTTASGTAKTSENECNTFCKSKNGAKSAVFQKASAAATNGTCWCKTTSVPASGQSINSLYTTYGYL